MNKLDHCYLEALSEALKGNLGEALELRNEADALASEGFSFSEDYGRKYPFIEEAVNTLLDSYEFTRCVRADGSAYGTSGKCRKGTETERTERERRETSERGHNHRVLLEQLKTLHKKLLLKAWNEEQQHLNLSPKVTLSAHRAWTGMGKPSLRYKVNGKPVSRELLAKTLQDSGIKSLGPVAST
jgi:hypothetical protein